MMQTNPSDLPITPALLGLSDIKIDNIRTASDGSIHIKVTSTKQEVLCRICQSSSSPHGLSRPLCLRHLSLLGREVYIEITPPRGICKRCDNKTTTTQTLDWFTRNGHQTKPYEDYLLLQLIGSTLVDVAKKENVTEALLQGVIDRNANSELNWKQIKRIGLLGIDEIAKLKGYNDFVTIVTGRHEGVNKILAVIKGKEKASIKAFLESIPHKKRKTITAVCVDMCDSYIDAVNEVLMSNY